MGVVELVEAVEDKDVAVADVGVVVREVIVVDLVVSVVVLVAVVECGVVEVVPVVVAVTVVVTVDFVVCVAVAVGVVTVLVPEVTVVVEDSVVVHINTSFPLAIFWDNEHWLSDRSGSRGPWYPTAVEKVHVGWTGQSC